MSYTLKLTALLICTTRMVLAHTHTASFGTTTPPELCLPTEACISHRECTFGSIKVYEQVRAALYSVTGFSTACENQCTCIQNTENRVAALLEEASNPANQYLYGNNSVCNDPKIHAAMTYITANFECESVFREAQKGLFGLCGMQNGIPCMGTAHCKFQYEIDVPVPPCRQRSDPQATANYVVTILFVILCLLWTAIPIDVEMYGDGSSYGYKPLPQTTDYGFMPRRSKRLMAKGNTRDVLAAM